MKHFSKNHIKYKAFIYIFSSLFVSSVFWGELILESNDTYQFKITEFIISLVFYILIYFVSLGYSILAWKFTTYSIDNESITLKKGILFKSKKILNFKNIHAIDSKQNIIQKLFKLKTLSIDSGATSTGGIPEIEIIEDEIQSLIIEKLVKEKLGIKHNITKEQDDNDGVLIYKYSSLNKFTLTCVVSFGVFLSLIGLYLVGSILISIIGVTTKEVDLLLIIFIGVIVLNVLIFIITYLYTLLSYYDYRVYKKEDYLLIRYGLITKINNILKINRIKAITVEESFIKRILKLATIKLEVVGFGDYTNEEISIEYNFYIPICKKAEINYYIAKIMPDCTLLDKKNRPRKNSFKFFYRLKLIIFLIVLFCLIPIPLFFNSLISFSIYFLFAAFGIIVLIIEAILLYNNSAISFDDKKIIVYTDSFFKITKIVPNKNVIGIEKVDTYFRRKQNVTSFIIHFYNTAHKNTVKAHLLDDSLFDDLLKLVKY